MVKEFNFETGNPAELTAGRLEEVLYGSRVYKDKRKSGYIRFKAEFGPPHWARRKHTTSLEYRSATHFLRHFCKTRDLILEEYEEMERLIFRVPHLL